MGKRRTRKQKEAPKHQFTVSWTPRPQKASVEANVKGQIEKRSKPSLEQGYESKKASILAKEGSFEAYKRDTVKSLILASLILGLEMVLYLAWK